MNEPNRERKGEIKMHVTLNEEQKAAKKAIVENQIVVITGRAGSGKSLVCAQAALDMLMKKMCKKVYVTRATIEVGASLGYLPGSLDEKFNPYLEALIENLNKCKPKEEIAKRVTDGEIVAFPVQFIRGKTIEDILIVEEAQNLTQPEMLAILTRLGKTGKIIINGDNDQSDIRDTWTGLKYVMKMADYIPEIKVINLKENHRSDLVGKILDWDYQDRKK